MPRVAMALAALTLHAGIAGAQTRGYVVEADAIPAPLANPGDVGRGRALALDKNGGACLLCHALPEARARFMGTMGPSLAGVGSRYSAGQLRLRVVDYSRVKQDAVMPSYFRRDGLARVAAEYRESTVLTAQQIEDVVAYLQTLK